MKRKEESGFDQIEYIKQYNKEHYKQIAIRVNPEMYDLIDKYAKEKHESKESLILKAIQNMIKNDWDI